MVQITYAPTPVPGERYKDEFGIYRCDTWDAAALGGQGAWKNDIYECEDQSDPPAPDAGPGAGVVVGGIFGGLAAVGLLAFLYARSKAGGEAYALKPNAMFRQGGSRYALLHCHHQMSADLYPMTLQTLGDRGLKLRRQ